MNIHPDWNMSADTYDVYQHYRFDGEVNPANLKITRYGQTLVPPQTTPFPSPMRVTYAESNQSQLPSAIRMVTPQNVVGHINTIDPAWTWNETKWQPQVGPGWLGENGGFGKGVGMPPEPIISLNPVVGEDFTGVTHVYGETVAGQVYNYYEDLPWRYTTIFRGVDAAYGTSEILICGLEERTGMVGDPSRYVYNHVFRGGRLIHELWGVRDANDRITGGWQLWCIAQG